MTRPLHIPVTEGLPDAGAPGQWLGRDAQGAVYTLRWLPQENCWGALGWSASDRRQPWPHLVLLREDSAEFIVGHVEGPAIAAAPRESFLAAALRSCAEDDRTAFAPIAARGVIRSPFGPGADRTHWSPWLWTVGMLFGLPAAALALVYLAANTPKAGGTPAAPGHVQERPHG